MQVVLVALFTQLQLEIKQHPRFLGFDPSHRTTHLEIIQGFEYYGLESLGLNPGPEIRRSKFESACFGTLAAPWLYVHTCTRSTSLYF